MMINLILFLVSTLFKEIGAKGFAEVIRMGVNKKELKPRSYYYVAGSDLKKKVDRLKSWLQLYF